MKNKNLLQYMVIISSLFLIISIMLTGCEPASPGIPASTPPQSANQPLYGGVVRLSYNRDAGVLGYPQNFSSPAEYSMSGTWLEKLGIFDGKGNMIPQLATGWKTDSAANTVTFELRKGVKFHDGTDFNAAAVKWNMDRYVAEKRTDVSIKSVDVIDDYTVRVNLPSWDSDCVWKLCYYPGAIISPTAFEKGGTTDKERKDWAIKNPVGTGPFQFVSWQKDVKATYKKFAGYWQTGKPYLDSVEWIIIADTMVQMASLKAGEIDAICEVQPKDAKYLKDSGFTIKTADTGGAILMGCDSRHEDSPFYNIKVRQAAAYAIDSKAIVDSLLYGFGKPANQWASPDMLEYNPNLKGYPYNPDKAKQLLVEAGYTKSVPVEFHITSTGDAVQVATAIQSYMNKVGFDVKLDMMDEGRRQEISYRAGWNNSMLYNSVRGWAILTQMRRFLHSKYSNYPAWGKAMIQPPEVDALIDKAVSAVDQKTQIPIVWQLQKAIFEDYLILNPILTRATPTAENTKLQDSGINSAFCGMGGQWDGAPNIWIRK